MKGKLGLMGKNHSDELYTPEYAFDILKEYIPDENIIKLLENVISSFFTVCLWAT